MSGNVAPITPVDSSRTLEQQVCGGASVGPSVGSSVWLVVGLSVGLSVGPVGLLVVVVGPGGSGDSPLE